MTRNTVKNGENIDQFAAFVGLDWADQKHDVCLSAGDSKRVEYAVVKQTPEAIDDWACRIRERFGGRPVAVCLLASSALVEQQQHCLQASSGTLLFQRAAITTATYLSRCYDTFFLALRRCDSRAISFRSRWYSAMLKRRSNLFQSSSAGARTLRSWGTLAGPSAFSPWAIMLVKNECASMTRVACRCQPGHVLVWY